MAATKATTEAAKQIVYLATALKAPRITEAAERLADQARDAGWTYEDYLVAVLEREVSARNASGAQLRIKAAGFPYPKTLEEFDWDAQPQTRPARRAHRPSARVARGSGSGAPPSGAPRPTDTSSGDPTAVEPGLSAAPCRMRILTPPLRWSFPPIAFFPACPSQEAAIRANLATQGTGRTRSGDRLTSSAGEQATRRDRGR